MRTPILLLLAASALAAQGVPPAPGGRSHVLPLDGIAVVELSAPDPAALLKEDLERREEGLPPRFALPNERHLTPEEAGTWESLAPDSLLWRLRIRSPGSFSLNLGFTRFRLPEGASLFLYSADRVHVVQPFTARDNESHGELWTPIVETDDLVVELVLPAVQLEELQLELGWINQGYRPLGRALLELERSGACHVDVVCPQGIPWELEIPSVGLITTNGTTFCTGFLVTNVRRDLKPYFMTANHCGVNGGNAGSLVVYWNHENSVCRPPGSAQSGEPGDGSFAQFSTGSYFRAASGVTDFTLLELDDEVDPAFDVSYAGWDATGANVIQAATIHQPNGSEKRISFEYQATSVTSYQGNSTPGDGTHVRVADWDLGSTEPGSSGAPLFDQAHHVIGQLHGGFASCTSQGADWYGRFSESWNGGGTDSTRLRNWLDPDGTGVLVADSISLDTLCTDQGAVALVRGHYGCSDTAEVLVVDCDLDQNAGALDSAVVTVFSNVDPVGEDVLLTETGLASGRFRGTVGLSTGIVVGKVTVEPGATLSARYVDADDGAGGIDIPVLDTALIDCAAPAVLSVVVTDVTHASAEITVTTDEPCSVEVSYGTDCAATPITRTSVGLATSSVVRLSGLKSGTPYFFVVHATDEAKNRTQVDNGGQCYAFTTEGAPQFFTQDFLGDNDMDGVVLALHPRPGSDGYVLCRRAATSFLTDPAGGTTLTLLDDDSAQVTLTGGKSVRFFGQALSSFYVNANGNLTFDASDDDYSETFVEHFAMRRVAALWDDLDPSHTGTVSWKQLSDRVAITWQDVPEYSSPNLNSFQIELFFAGTIRITCLSIGASDGLTGISRGTGLDPSFVEMDLSKAETCSGPAETLPASTPTVMRGF